MKNHSQGVAKFLEDRYRGLHHLLFVTLILFFWFLFSFERLKALPDMLKLVFYASTYIAVAYLNIYVLFPRFLMRGKIVTYVTLSASSFVCSYLVQNFIYMKGCDELVNDLTPSLPLLADMLINAITYCMFIGIGLSVKFIRKWMRSELRISYLEQEKLQATLSNLKSQVSPHFLFNTFNNLYVLTKTDPALACDMLLGFSDLMRYQLNECEKDKVKLEMEIDYIENFLKLEKLRKNHLDLQIKYDRNEIRDIYIEPLLFVSLIENAVKHGSQQMENAFIHVTVERVEGRFVFEVSNSRPAVSTLGREQSLGKGIENLRKRLNLSYPERHMLELNAHADRYTARIELQLT
jgi:two-component system, LytTR family, sensor kinase